MAKKTVFKGLINGQEFDNVQDYNKEMARLIQEGGNINAASSTSIQDVDETLQAEPDNDSGEQIKYYPNMLPGFNPPPTTGNFLDELVTEDETTDQERFESIKTFHKNELPLILHEIEKMDEHAAGNYLKDIERILASITEIQSVCVDSLKEIDKSLKELQAERNDINRCFPIIDEYKDLYQTLKNATLNQTRTMNTEVDNPCDNPCDSNRKNINAIEALKFLRSLFGGDSPSGGNM